MYAKRGSASCFRNRSFVRAKVSFTEFVTDPTLLSSANTEFSLFCSGGPRVITCIKFLEYFQLIAHFEFKNK